MWYWYLIAGIIVLVIIFIAKRKQNKSNHNDYDNHEEPPAPPQNFTPRPKSPQQSKTYKQKPLSVPKTEKDKFLYYERFRDFKRFDREDGFIFEDFVTRIFRRLGYRVIERTGQIQGEGNKNDHGIDIIFESAGIPVLIQCKCYSNEITYADIKEYPVWEQKATNLLKSRFQYILVTNNYLEPYARQYMSDHKIYCIELDQLRELYTLSENMNRDFTFCYEIKCNSYEYFTSDKFNKCEIGDILKFIVHKKSITIFNNVLKKRGMADNNLAKLTTENDSLAIALTTLYAYWQSSELECKIIEKRNYNLTLQIQIYKPASEPVNDYSKLLNAIFPNTAA